MGICVHDVVSALVQILHKAQVERAATILVALKLGNGSLRSLGGIESNYASTTRTTTRLVLDLSLLDLSDRGEQLNQVVVAGRPG
jgi:hypothetical protein